VIAILLIGYLVVSVIFFGSLAFMASLPAPRMDEEFQAQMHQEHCEHEEQFALRSA
jgi:hypothetical protein